jgi:hypothetical protein
VGSRGFFLEQQASRQAKRSRRDGQRSSSNEHDSSSGCCFSGAEVGALKSFFSSGPD